MVTTCDLTGTGCGSCRDGVVICELDRIQRCDECAPHWSDGDAAAHLREVFPWLRVAFVPDEDEDGAVADPAIGCWCVVPTEPPPEAPAWIRAIARCES